MSDASADKAKPHFRGQIDSIYQGAAAVGWAVTADGQPCTVAILVNDREIGTTRSDAPRPDVHKAGMSNGLGGWSMRILEALEPGLNRISARFPDGQMLSGTVEGVAGPEAPKVYRGAIECSEAPVLSGWSLADKEATSITLEMDDRAPLQIPALEPRPDLAGKGISNGEGGWSIDVSSMLLPGANHIRLRFPDGTELPGSPVTIYQSAGGDSGSSSATAGGTRFRGAVDRDRPPLLTGWSVGADGEPAVVTVTIDDGEPIMLAADDARPDLGGMSNGAGGWSLAIGDRLGPGPHTIRLRFPDGHELPGSPILIAPGDGDATDIRYTGAIDVSEPPMLSGWSLSSTRDSAPLTVTINDGEPFTVAAEGPRDDLAQSLSKGRGGWAIVVTDLLRPGANTIDLRFPDGSPMPGSPVSIRLPGGDPEPVAVPLADSPVAVEALAVAPSAPAEPDPEPVAPNKLQPLTLNELDEFSIDDLVDVVASGIFDFGQPEPAEEEAVAAPPEPAPEPERQPRKPGLLSRLLGRNRRES